MNIDKLVENKETVSEETVRDEDVRISPRTGKPVQTKYAPKKKRKSENWKKSPVIGMNGYDLKEGDNTKYLQINLELFNMPEIDLHNVDEVSKRLSDYFELYAKYDTKPTVMGMAMSLNGMDRTTLRCVAKDLPIGGNGYKSALPKPVTLAIKKAYFLLENLYENYMQNGKINPVAGIFLGKNNYGYQDKTEYVLTPNSNNEDEYSADDIKKRYLIAEKSGQGGDLPED